MFLLVAVLSACAALLAYAINEDEYHTKNYIENKIQKLAPGKKA